MLLSASDETNEQTRRRICIRIGKRIGNTLCAASLMVYLRTTAPPCDAISVAAATAFTGATFTFGASFFITLLLSSPRDKFLSSQPALGLSLFEPLN